MTWYGWSLQVCYPSAPPKPLCTSLRGAVPRVHASGQSAARVDASRRARRAALRRTCITCIGIERFAGAALTASRTFQRIAVMQRANQRNPERCYSTKMQPHYLCARDSHLLFCGIGVLPVGPIAVTCRTTSPSLAHA